MFIGDDTVRHDSEICMFVLLEVLPVDEGFTSKLSSKLKARSFISFATLARMFKAGIVANLVLPADGMLT